MVAVPARVSPGPPLLVAVLHTNAECLPYGYITGSLALRFEYEVGRHIQTPTVPYPPLSSSILRNSPTTRCAATPARYSRRYSITMYKRSSALTTDTPPEHTPASPMHRPRRHHKLYVCVPAASYSHFVPTPATRLSCPLLFRFRMLCIL